MAIALGIDIGGSGIKGSLVDLSSGILIGERHRIPTPRPALPNAIADVVAEIASKIDSSVSVACTIPGVVRHGCVFNATNLDETWEGLDASQLLSSRLQAPVTLLNDADSAGIAEMKFGAGEDFRQTGVVMMLTFGTGIGSAIFVDGHLVPNTELGSLELDGVAAEVRARGRLRREGHLTWDEWIDRVHRYLAHVELLFSPDLIIFGGGISLESAEFLHRLSTKAKLVPAKLKNDAGIVGAALTAVVGQGADA